MMNLIEQIQEDVVSFDVESRLLRELGERLVKTPDVALAELIKNSYDADATKCEVSLGSDSSLTISDNGTGMTLASFQENWMRLGTGAKARLECSKIFNRPITGEKGIGRFSVRFLGQILELTSVAYDEPIGSYTELTAKFNWSEIDKVTDLKSAKIPVKVEILKNDTPTGTTLTISNLRNQTPEMDLEKLKSRTLGFVNPLIPLIEESRSFESSQKANVQSESVDKGFSLNFDGFGSFMPENVASKLVNAFVLRAIVSVDGNNVDIKIHSKSKKEPELHIQEKFKNNLGKVYADIRFFPMRKGIFADIGIKSREAKKILRENFGVAVFDRNFRVPPYGNETDDWLKLQMDSNLVRKKPRSWISEKHLPLPTDVKSNKSINSIFKLPKKNQLIGIVRIESARQTDIDPKKDDSNYLIASADREGFIENSTFEELRTVIRSAIEAIAYVDQQQQLKEIRENLDAQIESLNAETNTAILEIKENEYISQNDKAKIISALIESQNLMERRLENSNLREQQLEVMSLLGIVAGYMTHEFGVALFELNDVQNRLQKLVENFPELQANLEKFTEAAKKLNDFVKFSTGYIYGTKVVPKDRYFVKPRIEMIVDYFGSYAASRRIDIEIDVENEIKSPLVPAVMYDGINLNLYTNALKAITSKLGHFKGKIVFRAWNDGKKHYMEVSDNGIGIPSSLYERVFDPLFSTSETQDNPFNSNMGLGLSLVRRCVYLYGGSIRIISPKNDMSTCIQVSFPLEKKQKK